jgi:hypothetical protein
LAIVQVNTPRLVRAFSAGALVEETTTNSPASAAFMMGCASASLCGSNAAPLAKVAKEA